MDKFEAVVFDLDGTLLDTIEDLTDSVNAALQQYSCSLKTVDQVLCGEWDTQSDDTVYRAGGTASGV